MALCELMVSDFLHGTGRIDPDMPQEPLRYTDFNLLRGIAYCEWLIEEFDYKKEPFRDFDLEEFIQWAKNILNQTKEA